MEVLRSEDGREVLVITWWEDRASFDAWVQSEEFCTPSTKVPRLTVTSVKYLLLR
jgi:heme-degrading monooxygenase HmoA